MKFWTKEDEYYMDLFKKAEKFVKDPANKDVILKGLKESEKKNKKDRR